MAREGREDDPGGHKVSSRERDRNLARLAGNRHRVVTTRQLLGLGFTRREIVRRKQGGLLAKRYRSVYSVGPGELDLSGRFMAAVAYAGEDAVLSGPAAASHNELAEWRGGLIDVTVPRRVQAQPGLRIHRCSLPPDERGFWRNVPVTTTGRTLLDCAATCTVREIELMLNEAFRKGLPLKPLPSLLLTRHQGSRGVGTLGAAVTAFEGGPTPTRSPLEERYLDLLDRHGIPRPLTNHPIPTGIGVLTVDCCWPDQRLVIEIDAPSTHGARPSMLNDRRRDRALILAGWTPGRLMEEDLGDEAALAAEITALLAA